MKNISTLLLTLLFAMVTASSGDVDDDSLIVPKPVMSFIMNCQRSIPEEKLVPVFRTDVISESGTTSQQVSLLGIDELQASLRQRWRVMTSQLTLWIGLRKSLSLMSHLSAKPRPAPRHPTPSTLTFRRRNWRSSISGWRELCSRIIIFFYVKLMA